MRQEWAFDVASLHRHFVSEFIITSIRFNVAYILHETEVGCGTLKNESLYSNVYVL
jgi:hypothetical protein